VSAIREREHYLLFRSNYTRMSATPLTHGLTAVDDRYEPPPDPDLVLDGTRPIEDRVAALETLLGERGLL
jgi:hypothetical protein